MQVTQSGVIARGRFQRLQQKLFKVLRQGRLYRDCAGAISPSTIAQTMAWAAKIFRIDADELFSRKHPFERRRHFRLAGRLDPRDVHSHLRIQIVDLTVTFVNGGFPVNFDGRVNCIPGRYIQPTPTMMVAAAIQAVEAMDDGQRGLIELDPVFCDWVRRAFEAELGDERDLSSGWDQVKTGS